METSTAITIHPATQRPPGLPNTLFGMINMIDLKRDNLGFADRMARYGDVSFAKIGPYALYLLNHPDLIHQVLVEQWEKFNKWHVQKQVIGQVIGNGTFNIDGEYWKQQRKLVQPAFHAKRIAAYADVIVDETRRVIDSWQMGAEYNLSQQMYNVAMTIISRLMFGADVQGREEEISQALTTCLEIETQQMQALFRLPAWLPTPAHLRFQRAIKLFDGLMNHFISARRRSNVDTGDLLSMLLLAADEERGGHLSDKEVRDEALTLFSAGHETSANTLSWTWVELAKHPEIEEKLVEEVRRVLGDRVPTLQDLRNLPYTEMVIKESLRLHPPAWGFMREAMEDVTIGGWRIPKGNLVFLCPHVTHRDPRFFEQPAEFTPERFAAGYEKRIPRYAYFPFGGGPHICTGQSLAMMEAPIILAMMVQRCKFTLTPGQDFMPHIAILQRPGKRVRATVTPR
ncbi:MAG: cytochrome P450 [Aggregatilineales bacterium]